MIKLTMPVVTGLITSLINKSIETSIFPDQLKVAQVKPLFKNKNDQLDKTNYRPVSVLPAISKFFERTIFDQLSSFFENHLNFMSREGKYCTKFLNQYSFICSKFYKLYKYYINISHNKTTGLRKGFNYLNVNNI